jgi:hypothetical protein
MWPEDDQMQAFRALAYGDKWRVRRTVSRGEAPQDPQMALAALELAEAYQRQGPLYAAATRWWPLLMVVIFTVLALPRAIEGDVSEAIIYALTVATCLIQYTLDPATKPKKVARSLAASRQVVAAYGGRPARVEAPAPPQRERLDSEESHTGLDLESGYGWSAGKH